MIGKLKCDILMDRLDHVQEQLEFLAELETTTGTPQKQCRHLVTQKGVSAELYFIRALLAQKKSNEGAYTEFLRKTLDTHQKLLREQPVR